MHTKYMNGLRPLQRPSGPAASGLEASIGATAAGAGVGKLTVAGAGYCGADLGLGGSITGAVATGGLGAVCRGVRWTTVGGRIPLVTATVGAGFCGTTAAGLEGGTTTVATLDSGAMCVSAGTLAAASGAACAGSTTARAGAVAAADATGCAAGGAAVIVGGEIVDSGNAALGSAMPLGLTSLRGQKNKAATPTAATTPTPINIGIRLDAALRPG